MNIEKYRNFIKSLNNNHIIFEDVKIWSPFGETIILTCIIYIVDFRIYFPYNLQFYYNKRFTKRNRETLLNYIRIDIFTLISRKLELDYFGK